jgi:hypothetical protein
MILGMTIYDRSPDTIRAVMASLRFPGNWPNTIAVCYDRATQNAVDTMRAEAALLGVELRETWIRGEPGFRCPSKAWNAVFDLIHEDHAFCISSDCVLGPHSLGWAYHIEQSFPDAIIVGKAEHCGPSYYSTCGPKEYEDFRITCRTLTSSMFLNPLGFAWLLPMRRVRDIGGYDRIFMDGLCYEDNDFVIRMWNNGADIIFCDDVLALHMEHKREYVLDKERVAVNEKIYVDRYGDIHYLKRGLNLCAHTWVNHYERAPGLGVWFHKKDDALVKRLMDAQYLYGNDADWRAIPGKIRYEQESP